MSFFSKVRNLFTNKKSANLSDVFIMLGDSLYLTDYSNVKFALEGYKLNIITYRCISLIVNQAKVIDYQLFEGDKKIENNPLLDLLNNPYFQTSKSEFIEWVLTLYLIYGQSFIWMRYPGDNTNPIINQLPQFLIHLFPNMMQVQKGKNFLPSKYTYTENDSMMTFQVGITGESNIIQMKSVNPTNRYVGMSPMVPAGKNIDQSNELTKWNVSLLQNGARPSGILVAPKDVEFQEGDVDRIKREIESRYSGSDNAGKPMVLSGGLQWTSLSHTPQDMDFKEADKTASHKIALGFNVPLTLLNTEQAKFENLKVAYEQLWDEAVTPLLGRYFDELNTVLVPRAGNKNYKLVPDTSKSIALKEKKARERESLEKVTYMTINEKRKQIGLDPVIGGDEILIKLTDIALDQLGAGLINDEKSYHLKLIKAGHTSEEAKQLIKVIYGNKTN